MSTYLVQPPFNVFYDIDGTPLENGFIYIGTLGLNPEVSPIPIYSDQGLTQPLSQPIRTLNGIAYSTQGSIKNIYASQQYSITVRNKNKSLIFSSLYFSDPFISALSGSLSAYDGERLIGSCPDVATLRTIAGQVDGQKIRLLSYTSGWAASLSKPKGGGLLVWESLNSSTDDGVVVFNPGQSGSGRWIRCGQPEPYSLYDAGAVGGGVDDYQAIMRAVSALGGKTIAIPSDTFSTSSTIIPPIAETKFLGTAGSKFINIGSTNVFQTFVDGTVWENITIDGSGKAGYGIGCHSNRNRISSCAIANCGTQSLNGGGVYFDITGTALSQIDNNLIENSIVSANGWIGIACHSAKHTKIIGNRISGNGLEAVTLDYDSLYCVVDSNIMYGNCTWGGVGTIGIDGGNLSTITGNNISSTVLDADGTSGYGITMQGNVRSSNNITISGNVFNDNVKGGIHLRYRSDTGFTSDFITISGNIFLNNNSTAYPVVIDSGCTNVKISGNTYGDGKIPQISATSAHNITVHDINVCFLLTNSVSRTDVSGDGTVYTIPFDVGNNNYTSNGIFTAPISGWYQFSSQTRGEGFTSSHTYFSSSIVCSGGKSFNNNDNFVSSTPTAHSTGGGAMVFLSKGETVRINCSSGGGSKVIDIPAGAADTYFCGAMIG